MAKLDVTIDGSGAKRGASEVTRSLDDIRRKTDESSGAFRRQAKQVDATQVAFSQLKRVVGPLVAAFGAREILNTANQYATLQNQLRVVTGSTEELAAANERLFEISQNTRQPLEATVQLFSRASIAAKELGATQDELYQLVEVTGQALAVQGGAASEASGALRQLSQSFSSGIVRAEEFNSILEGAFPLAQAAARGLDEAGGSVGRLRSLVVEGEVTSREFFEAILKGGEQLSDQFAQTEVTVGQALTNLGNSFLRMVGLISETTGASTGLASVIQGVSKQVDTLTKALTGTLQPQDEVNSGLQVFTTALLVASRTVGLLADSLITTLVTPFEAVGNAIGGTAAALVQFADGEFTQAADTIKAAFGDSADIVVTNYTELRDEMVSETSDTIEKLVELWDTGARDIAEAASKAAPEIKAPEIDPDAAEKAKKLAEALDKQAEALKLAVDPAYAYEQELAKINELLITDRISQEQADAAITEAGATYAAATVEGQKYADMLAEAARVTEDARTPLEDYAAEVQNYKNLLDAGLISQETFNRSVEDAAKQLKDATDKNSGAAKAMEQFAIQSARNIQSAFADFLYDPFDQGLEGMVSGFADAMRKIAAEALANAALNAVFSAFAPGAGAAGGGGGFLASLGSAFAGRALGGDLQAGQPAIVGERGKPEIFIPRENGTVVPAEKMGGQTNVEVPVNIQNVVDPSGMVAAIDSPQGQKAILNVIQLNPDAVKKALS